MDAKTHFVSNKELREWWSDISNTPKFDLVLLHAAAIALETCPSAEQREGVIFLKNVLLTMSNADSETPNFPSPGLNHNLDSARKTLETDKTPTK